MILHLIFKKTPKNLIHLALLGGFQNKKIKCLFQT